MPNEEIEFVRKDSTVAPPLWGSFNRDMVIVEEFRYFDPSELGILLKIDMIEAVKSKG